MFKPDKNSSQSIESHLNGVYWGVMPCADCPGIETRLLLKNDGHYERVLFYQERSEQSLLEQGSYQLEVRGNEHVIRMLSVDSHEFFYWVNQGKLYPIAQDEPLLSDEITTRPPLESIAPISELVWEFVQLGEEKLLLTTEQRSHFRLKATSNQVVGYTGCNRFTGSYEMEGTELRFLKVMATKRACLGEHYEAEFQAVLEACRTYHLDTDSKRLHLMDEAGGLLGVFEAS